MTSRTCSATSEGGRPCRQAPLRDEEFCFWHSPEHAQEAADARKVGGSRRKRERTVAAIYEVEGLDTVPHIRRLFEIAGVDALALDAGPVRCRLLVHVGLAALKALDLGEHEERLQAIEDVLGPKLKRDGRRR
jgi:hypothetical protein